MARVGGMKTATPPAAPDLQVSGMAPLSRIGIRRSTKRDRKSITLHVKLEVLRRFEEGEKLTQIARALGLATSTVASIRVNKEKIQANSQAATPVSATQVTRCRSVVMGHMERLLSLWIEEQKRQNLPVTTLLIQDKARRLFAELQREQGEGAQAETFGASNGWFARFKARHNVLLTDEPAVADAQAAARYPAVLRGILEEGHYLPQQVFNVDETGLFWKRLPERTLLALEGAAGPGPKASKDHLTLLLGGNAAGDFKLKPLLVYPSENPRALKGCSKASLPVIWRSNRNDWLTPSIFQEWFTGCFCPAVENYCAQNGLPHRALLLLDVAPCHPAHLDGLSAHVRVEFLPKNTSTLIQPMNQGVIAAFKAHYLRRTLSQLVQETAGEDRPSVQEFWRSYTVMTAVDNIAEAWAELQPTTLNGAWRKLWPECVPDGIPEPDAVPQLRCSIVALASHVGLGDLAEADVACLLQAHGEPLHHSGPQYAEDGDTGYSGPHWEEGKGLASKRPEQELPEAREGAGAEEAGLGRLSPEHLAQALSHFATGLRVLVDNDPNRERSLRVSRGVHSALACLRELHRDRRRQARVALAAKESTGGLSSPQGGPTEDTQAAEATDPGGYAVAALQVLPVDSGFGSDLR
ncbi:tigger transposable element-derived protein 1-like [Elephas maximus indicus]|uniref:tigger transposable element-derived protein 1-like n=1 Tax=Elephas maximus indicus TaxID=99487 RepID=UPI0021169CC1|nr:tigger transposable element-derived protein 1-like [Elephas maximus indicus]XP_049758086.1 tigger transposable element-derived protein 1-like [Elephas maximus indicus]XP_049758087.1 tigger transposable element-derived protein 1-like [Elephas maximus indicus]XP_049758088.1 tigger transposable element-derived protein 1-like [Elephas maximus indicus]XP_049758089.1 tigger transposable element-derived protein 1-like [Elephas maximus indicus]